MGTALTAIGALIMLVGGVMVLIKAFQKSILWGLGSLCVPFVSIVFVILNWSEPQVKKGFLIQIGGLVIYIAGIVLGGANPMMPHPK